MDEPSKPELTIMTENEFKFDSSLATPQERHLTLHNQSDRTVLFSVKSTDPKSWVISPHTGPIEPLCVAFVSIQLKPGFTLSSDRFVIQAVFAPDGPVPEKQLWGDLSRVSKLEVPYSIDLCIDLHRYSVAHEGTGRRSLWSRIKETFTVRYNKLKPAR